MKCHFPLMTLGLVGVLSIPVVAAPTQAPPVVAPEKVPVTLSATLTKQKFDANEPVDLTVTLVNKSDKTVDLGFSSERLSQFDIVVRSAGGPVDRTAFYKDAFAPMPGAFANAMLTLPPKGKQRIVFPLRRLLDLSGGGDFFVEVTRTFELGWAVTNVLPPNASGFGPRSYRKEVEVKVAPPVSFSITPPPDIQQEFIP